MQMTRMPTESQSLMAPPSASYRVPQRVEISEITKALSIDFTVHIEIMGAIMEGTIASLR